MVAHRPIGLANESAEFAVAALRTNVPGRPGRPARRARLPPAVWGRGDDRGPGGPRRGAGRHRGAGRRSGPSSSGDQRKTTTTRFARCSPGARSPRCLRRHPRRSASRAQRARLGRGLAVGPRDDDGPPTCGQLPDDAAPRRRATRPPIVTPAPIPARRETRPLAGRPDARDVRAGARDANSADSFGLKPIGRAPTIKGGRIIASAEARAAAATRFSKGESHGGPSAQLLPHCGMPLFQARRRPHLLRQSCGMVLRASAPRRSARAHPAP